ncbi:hypothetical protein OC834_006884 [Tilletia horrida]|nr:hypothetical protein OC834_006884 [Tilletia horrida]KAK0549275.1 hypothetical protein OC844_006888 [Tilletia horrida]
MSSDAYAAHIVSRIQADLDFLESAGHLRAADAASIRQTLQASSGSSAAATPAAPLASAGAAMGALSSRAGAVTSRFAQLAASKRSAPSPPVASASAVPASPSSAPAPASAQPQPQQELARAIWSYTAAAGATDELSFEEGDTLVVVERTSADWWKGYVASRPSEPKLYPSNYVESIAVAAPASSRNLPPAYAFGGAGANYSEKGDGAAYTASGRLIPKARFSSGGPAVVTPPADAQSQAVAGPSSQNGPAGLTPVMTEEQKGKKKDGMKKLGGTMAHGAAGGVGFGVGVGLVNALF